MKITSLEQALGRIVCCTDGFLRRLTRIHAFGLNYYGLNHGSPVWHTFRGVRRQFSIPLFVGGTTID